MSGGWYVTKGDTGQRAGPVTDAGFRNALLSGQVDANDQVWCEGMDAWERAEPFIWFAGQGASAAETDAAPEPARESEPAPRPAPDASAIGKLERPESGAIGKVLGREISISEPDLADFIGTNTEPYLKFRQKLIDKGGRVWMSWCWPAFFVPMAWLAYRRRFGYLFAMSICVVVLMILAGFAAMVFAPAALALFVFPLVMALIGKRLILRRADQAAELADSLDLVPAKRPAFMAAQGGVSSLAGWAGALLYLLSIGFAMLPTLLKYADHIPKGWSI